MGHPVHIHYFVERFVCIKYATLMIVSSIIPYTCNCHPYLGPQAPPGGGERVDGAGAKEDGTGGPKGGRSKH